MAWACMFLVTLVFTVDATEDRSSRMNSEVYRDIHSAQIQPNAARLIVDLLPRIAKSTKGGRTFSHLAPKLWNSLPDNVRVQTHSLYLNLD